jgi:hypothetical protein
MERVLHMPVIDAKWVFPCLAQSQLLCNTWLPAARAKNNSSLVAAVPALAAAMMFQLPTLQHQLPHVQERIWILLLEGG